MTEAIDVTFAKELLVVVDRLVVGDEARGRLADAVGTAFREGDGDCVILFTETVSTTLTPRAVDAAALHRALRVRERRHARPDADAAALLVQQPARRLRALQRIRRDARVRRSADRSLPERIAARRRDRSVDQAALRQQAPRARRVREARGHLDGHAVAASCPRARAQKLLNARSRGLQGHLPLPRRSRGEEVQAVHPRLPAAVSDGAGVSGRVTAPSCSPSRCRCASPVATIAEVSELPGRSAARVARRARARRQFERQVAAHILKEARDRVQFLCDVGLELSHAASRARARSPAARRSASGSPTRSARSSSTRSTCSTSRRSVCTPRDMDRLLRLLHRLRDGGNTVLVVEHDPEAIRAADYMVELGPGERREGRPARVRRADLAHRREPAHRRVSHRRDARFPFPPSAGASVRDGSRSPARASTTSRASTSRSRSAPSPR